MEYSAFPNRGPQYHIYVNYDTAESHTSLHSKNFPAGRSITLSDITNLTAECFTTPEIKPHSGKAPGFHLKRATNVYLKTFRVI